MTDDGNYRKMIWCVKCWRRFRGTFNHRNRLQSACPRKACGGCKEWSLNDREFVERTVNENLRLPKKLVNDFIRCRSWSKGHVEKLGGWDELFQEASSQLWRAARQFDAGKGFRFSTYAVMAIKRRLDQWTQRQYSQCAVGIVTRNERGQTVNCTPFVPLDAATDDGPTSFANAVVVVPDIGLEVDLQDMMEQLNKIPENYRDAVLGRYMKSQSYEELAGERQVSRSRVMQLVRMGVAHLAERMGDPVPLQRMRDQGNAQSRAWYKKQKVGTP